MAMKGMSLVWSPKSNVFLYGAGTDLTKTANIPLALSKGINIALAPDWSIGGSIDLLDELRFAKKVGDTIWGSMLTPQMLTDMVTKNAAKAVGLEATLGTLEVGKKADIMVIGGDASMPYDALLAAQPKDVKLVLVGGVPLYGDMAFEALGPASPGCEALDVCSVPKFICVATTTTPSANKFEETLVTITSTISQALTDYDAMNLTPDKFAPIAPLFKCE